MADAIGLRTPVIARVVNADPAWVVQGPLLTKPMPFAVDAGLGALGRRV